MADKSLNISTVDQDAVLEAARELEIDGVLAYGTDIAALTAARVSEELGLATHPSESIQVLTEKHRFREHLERNGFRVPDYRTADNPRDLEKQAQDLSFPAVLKPVDSSGSKGVAKVDDPSDLAAAFDEAAGHSRRDTVIVEEFINKKGYQLTGDGFLNDGKLVFRAFANQHFAPAGDSCQPTGESLPAAFSEKTQQRIHDEIQRLMSGLNMRTGALNFDILVDHDDRINILEIGPRCGGNLLPTLIHNATGVDLSRAAVEAALGHPVQLEQPSPTVPFASFSLNDYLTAYGLKNCARDKRISFVFKRELLSKIVFSEFLLSWGGRIPLRASCDLVTPPFHPDDLSIGFLLMRFDAPHDAFETLDRIDRYIELREHTSAANLSDAPSSTEPVSAPSLEGFLLGAPPDARVLTQVK